MAYFLHFLMPNMTQSSNPRHMIIPYQRIAKLPILNATGLMFSRLMPSFGKEMKYFSTSMASNAPGFIKNSFNVFGKITGLGQEPKAQRLEARV